MREHLSDDGVVDILADVAGEHSRRHLEGCPPCRERVAEARAGWDLAREAEVPEPSPLYWESFRRQVHRRIAGEAAGGRRWRVLVPTLALAAGVVVASFLPSSSPVAPVEPARLLPAWSALPPGEEDEGLLVLQALAPAPEELEPAAECEIAECLAELSDEESQALAAALQRGLAPGRGL
jgi:hypothetical protein